METYKRNIHRSGMPVMSGGAAAGGATAANQTTLNTEIGATNEAAAAGDTSTSGLNGLFKRLLQRITTLLAIDFATSAKQDTLNNKLPSLALGDQTKVSALSVTPATDSDVAKASYQGPTNETAPATDTAASGHNGRLQRIAQRLTSLITLFPTSLGGKAGSASLSVVNATDGIAIVSDEFARPANTTAYAANDVIGSSPGAVRSLASALRISGGMGYITKVRVATDQAACTAQIRVHFYQSAPAAQTDNDPFQKTYVNRAVALGYVDLPAFATEDGGTSTSAEAMNTSIILPVKSATQAIYYVLETKTAFTPNSAQSFFLEITVDQN